MNSRLSGQAAGLRNEPFVAQLQTLYRGTTADHFDGSFIQGVLNPDYQQQLRQTMQQLPAGQRESVTSSFEHFLFAAKVGYSNATGGVFLVASLLMLVALVLVFFLPEIPLRKSDQPAAENIGKEPEDEFAQRDGERVPEFLAAKNRRGAI